MSTKTQFLGPISSGLLAGNPALNAVGHLRFSTITTINSAPVTGLPILVLPQDGVLEEINVTQRNTIVGEAQIRFGTTADGSDNIGSVTTSARNRYAVTFSATAMATTIPLGRAPISAEPATIYVSTGATSGSLVSLGGTIVECIFTRLPFTDDAANALPFLQNNTLYRGPITSGIDKGFAPEQNPLGYARLSQYTTVNTAPVTGQVVGCLPPGAKLDNIDVFVRTALAGEGRLRFAIGSAAGSDNIGSVALSGVGKFSVNTVTAMATLPFGVNNTGSALPIYATLLPVSGSVAGLAGNVVCDIQFTRYGARAGYPGVGQKETNFKQAVASGRQRGTTDPPKGVGWTRFVQMTTVGVGTNGVLSGVQIGVIPPGAYLSDVIYNLRSSIGGEMRTRLTTTTGIFTSDNLGIASLSGAGRYSIVQTTANITLPNGVNMTGADIPIYLSTLALSGSISVMTANSVIEMIYTRLDPSIYGG